MSLLVACSSEGDTSTDRRPLLATLCDPSLCGDEVPLGAPNYECADGSIAGPACVEVAPGECSWQILECDGADECTSEECGPPPTETNWICEGDTIAGPACVRVEGVCTWQDVVCGEPGHPDSGGCSEDDPGSSGGDVGCECAEPAPLAPNYLCGDGQTIAGPACEPIDANACGWVIRACP